MIHRHGQMPAALEDMPTVGVQSDLEGLSARLAHDVDVAGVTWRDPSLPNGGLSLVLRSRGADAAAARARLGPTLRQASR